MVWKRRREAADPTDQAVQYLAGLAESAGDNLGSVLHMGLDGMDPALRTAVLLKIVGAMPPIARLAILRSNALLGEQVDEAVATLDTEARRPLIVRALLDRSFEKPEVDLQVVPEGVDFSVRLYQKNTNSPPPPPSAVYRQPFMGALAFTSLGEGRFATQQYTVLHPNSAVDRSKSVVQHEEIVLGNLTPTREFTSTIQYGRTLHALHKNDVYEVGPFIKGDFPRGYVGMLSLDAHSAFVR